jgi:hypothetical protein
MFKIFSISLGLIFLINSCQFDKYSVTDKNYSEEVAKYAEEYNLPQAYLKSLIILECSGNKPAGKRFESNVYRKLKEVQSGARRNFEFVTRNKIINCTDDALRNLATSWGPFQIMGYKCVNMGILIKDLRGEDAVKWGVKWIDNEYGYLLRMNQFEKAFRVHNTGSPSGRTYDKNYVQNGLDHINYFSN